MSSYEFSFFIYCVKLKSAVDRCVLWLNLQQLAVGSDLLSPVNFVRELGIYVDADLSMRTHVLRTAGRCFAVLRQIRSIRRSVTRPVLESLVVSLVFVEARLRMCDTGRSAESAARQTPVGSECCSAADLR